MDANTFFVQENLLGFFESEIGISGRELADKIIIALRFTVWIFPNREVKLTQPELCNGKTVLIVENIH